MERHSSIGARNILKLFMKHARHPWVAEKLVKLQAEKWFFDALQPGAAEGRARKIRQLSIRITDVCNLRCVMCGQWGERGFLKDRDLAELRRRELPPERYIALLDDLVSKGHRPTVYLWGGEPMMYPGALDVIRHASSLRLPTSIATNGTRLDGALEELVAAPLYLLQISVDGHCAEVHNRIRRSVSGADSFGRICDAIDQVRVLREERQSSLPLIATLTTVSRDNCANLVDIYERFCGVADMCVFYLSWWIDEDAAQKHEADFEQRFGFAPELHRGWIGGWRPDNYSALADQLQEIRKLSARPGMPPAIILPDVAREDDLRRYYTDHAATFGYDRCLSIYQAVEIDSNGDMSPCRDYHDFVVGNVGEQTITEIWNNWLYRKFRASLHGQGLMPACSRCCGLMGY